MKNSFHYTIGHVHWNFVLSEYHTEIPTSVNIIPQIGRVAIDASNKNRLAHALHTVVLRLWLETFGHARLDVTVDPLVFSSLPLFTVRAYISWLWKVMSPTDVGMDESERYDFFLVFLCTIFGRPHRVGEYLDTLYAAYQAEQKDKEKETSDERKGDPVAVVLPASAPRGASAA